MPETEPRSKHTGRLYRKYTRTMVTQPSVPGGLANIPTEARSSPSGYVERSDLVSEVVSSLTAANASSAPYVLFGMGGAGKTVLASSVVRNRDAREHFRGGIFWLSVGRAGENQRLALLEGLAAKMIVAPMGSRNFNSEDEAVRS
ncbi:unnamed protein product, partial [Sphacelaria rigidula]